MNCQEVRESFEPFIDEELSVEMLNKINLHVAACSACGEMIGLRERFDARLRNAIAADSRFSPDPEFVARLQSEFSPKSSRSFALFGSGWRLWFASGLSAALLLTIGTYYFGVFRSAESEAVSTNPSSTQPEAATPSAVAVPAAFRTLVNMAVEEHKSCTLTNLTSNHHAAAVNPEAIFLGDHNLDEAVRAAVQKEVRHNVSAAASHFCEAQGQAFRHLILREREGYISVLVTDAGNRQQDENAIFCETIEGSSVACFKSQRKTVFVVSERSEEANLRLAQGITPTVRSVLNRSSQL